MDLNKDLELILNDKTDTSTFISSLDSYLNTIETNLTSWLNQFEWNRDVLVEDSSAKHLQCPLNKAHSRISEKNFEKHIERCRLKSLDFSVLDIVILNFINYKVRLFIILFQRLIILVNRLLIQTLKLIPIILRVKLCSKS